jgi:hypothetical protein
MYPVLNSTHVLDFLDTSSMGVKTEEVRLKQVNSLKTYKLQDQLVAGKFGASCKNLFQNIKTRPVVL